MAVAKEVARIIAPCNTIPAICLAKDETLLPSGVFFFGGKGEEEKERKK